jgi:TM2 domain-containing membrane protein YozV
MSSPETPMTPPLPPAGAAPAGPVPALSGLVKNPWAAAALSFLFPGLGQIYNGQTQKAFVFFAAFAGFIFASAEINPMPFAFGIPFTYLFGIVDAFRSAAILNARAAGRSLDDEVVAESPAWGISLIVLGVVFLLHNFGWLSLEALARWWPVVLIVAGAVFLKSSLARRAGARKGSDDLPL